MLFSFGEWLTVALAASGGISYRHADTHTTHTHDICADFERASSALASSSLTGTRRRATSLPSQASLSWAGTSNSVDFEWPHPPITRARVFAERLADVRPICLQGRRDDRENCLLDLPVGVHLDVSAHRLMLAGCEASLPPELQTILSTQNRSADALEQAFSEAFASQSAGQYAVPALERRLTKRLHQMSSGMRRLLDQTNAYIEIPQLTFQRLITSEQEARRHRIYVPLPGTNTQLPAGDTEVHDAMLGAYLRIPIAGWIHTLLVSLASPLTVEAIRQPPTAHTAQHMQQMFGDVPPYWQTSNLQMRRVEPGDDVVRTLAEHLHDGHLRYRTFAYGATREALAPESHALIRQTPCYPDPQAPTTPSVPALTSASIVAQAREAARDHTRRDSPLPPSVSAQPRSTASTDTPGAPVRTSKSPPSLAELAQALAELERLDNEYMSYSRPRFG